MYISELRLSNYRSCRGVTVALRPDLTVLAGENNAGKSTVVDALRVLTDPLEQGRAPWPLDADVADRKEFCELGVTLADIGSGQSGTYLEARVDPAVPGGFEARWGYEYRRSVDGERRGVAAWSQGSGVPCSDPAARRGVRHVYLQPLRDAVRDLGGASVGRIRAVLAGLLGGPNAIAEFLEKAQAALNGVVDLKVVTRLQEEINRPLLEFTTGAHPQKADFRITDPNLAAIARTLQMMIGDAEGLAGPLSSSGLGYANALYIATVLAELRALKDNDLTLLLVEEPEAHLHPQLQTLLLRHLRQRAQESRAQAEGADPTAPAGHLQVVVTTHSPVLSASVSVRDVVVMTRRRHTSGWEGHAVPVDKLGLDDKQVRKVDRLLDVTRNALLYAPRAILVEGLSEVLLLPALARRVLATEDEEQAVEAKAALERFHGTTMLLVDSVGFSTYLTLLLASVGGACIAQRLALITDTDRAEDADDPGRIENYRALEKAHQGRFAAFAGARSLEPQLWLPGNEDVLRDAFLACRPQSQHRWDAVKHAPDPATAFWGLFDAKKDLDEDGKEKHQNPLSKPQFAQELADILEQNPNRPFHTPDYLRKAILFITARDDKAPSA